MTNPVSGRAALLAAAVVALAACSSGPTDFVDVATLGESSLAPPQQVHSDAQKAALEHDLSRSGDALAARGASADAGLPSAMALAIIRQQQNEEAKALLEEARASPPPAATRDVAPAACADGRPRDSAGACPSP